MGTRIVLHVGDSLETVGARFVDAWTRAEAGALSAENAEVHLGFSSWEAVARALAQGFKLPSDSECSDDDTRLGA